MKKIAPDVIIGKDVQLNEFINRYGCTIGDNTKIGPFVEIQKNASIGKNCKIQSHTFYHQFSFYKSGKAAFHKFFVRKIYPCAC